MRRFLVLLVKEEKALFSSPIAYVLIAVFLLIMGYSFTLALFISHAMTLVHLFFQIFVLFLLTVPIITMRLIAEGTEVAHDRAPAHLTGNRNTDRVCKVRSKHEPHRTDAHIVRRLSDRARDLWKS
jgi:predicted membrane protein